MTIVWSDSAKESYEKLIDNILNIWGISVAEKLEEAIINLEERLKIDHELCPESKERNLRKCKVHKLTSLIYRIVDDNRIEIVQLIQNRMSNKY